jgi:predicted phage tail protein
MFVVDVPAGWFYARVRALNGSIPGAPSNEVRVFVNAPVAPSAPANLLALVDGSTVTLTWTPTFEGGAPTSFALEVAGATVATVPAGLVDHTTVAGVLPGTYRVAVRALNDSGHSERSNTVTLTIPAACPGAPAVPVDVRVNRSGRRVSIYWTPGPTGPAPIAYAVIVTGSTLGSVATTERTLSGALGPGTYALSVVAVTPCGVSAGSPPLAILVP